MIPFEISICSWGHHWIQEKNMYLSLINTLCMLWIPPSFQTILNHSSILRWLLASWSVRLCSILHFLNYYFNKIIMYIYVVCRLWLSITASNSFLVKCVDSLLLLLRRNLLSGDITKNFNSFHLYLIYLWLLQ